MTSMQNSQPTPVPDFMSGMGSRFTPIDPIRLFRKYMWVLLITVVVGLIGGFVLTKILEVVYPLYRAVSQLEVSPEIGDIDNITRGSFRSEDDRDAFKITQAHFLKSPRVLGDTLKRADVKNTSWYQSFATFDDALLELEEDIVITPVRMSYLIEVSIATHDPEDSENIVKTLVAVYMQEIETENQTLRYGQKKLYTDGHDLLTSSIARVRTEMREIIPDKDLSAVMGKQHEIDLTFAKKLEEYQELQTMLTMTQSSYQVMMEKKQSGEMDFTLEDEAVVEQDIKVKSRDDELLRLREEMRVLEVGMGQQHTTIRQIRQRIKAKEIERDNEKERLLIQLQNVKLAETESAIGSMQGAVEESSLALEVLRRKREELFSHMREYDIKAEEMRLLEERRAHYNDLADQIDLMRENPRAVQVRVRFPAMADSEMMFPKLEIMMTTVPLILVIIVGGGLVLWELFDQRIKSPSCTGLLPCDDLLGVIPMSREDPSGHDLFDLVTVKHPTGLLAEVFRQLRMEVAGRMDEGGLKTLMMAGSQPDGGVSSVTANLAASFAMDDRRTVIVDINWRRPSQHKIFGVDNVRGIGDVLSGKASLDEVIYSTRVDGLDVIPVGQSGMVVRDKLSRPELTDILAQLASKYDFVLLDAPPLSIISDSVLLSGRVDAVLIVIRAIQEKRGVVSRMMRQLQDSGANTLGMVLNGVRSSAGGYFRRNYKAFYEYQSDMKGSQESAKVGTSSASASSAGDNLG